MMIQIRIQESKHEKGEQEAKMMETRHTVYGFYLMEEKELNSSIIKKQNKQTKTPEEDLSYVRHLAIVQNNPVKQLLQLSSLQKREN